MEFIEGINTLQNYIAGYWHAFAIYKKQLPDSDEHEYIEFVALPQAQKAYNSTPTQAYILKAKVERGKFVRWIEQRQKELKKAPKPKPKATAKPVEDIRVPSWQNTRDKYIKIDAYYRQQYTELKNYTLAVKATIKHFAITERTLERAWAYAQYLKEQ